MYGVGWKFLVGLGNMEGRQIKIPQLRTIDFCSKHTMEGLWQQNNKQNIQSKGRMLHSWKKIDDPPLDMKCCYS